jgi:DNA-binding Lrp family transcriptional regulator
MSLVATLPAHLRPRREKLFGDGRPRALDRNAKARIMTFARALTRRTEKGKAYGPITAKALAVLEALLWGFHNARSGLCFPSYETIAKRAGCARSTVGEAIKALEEAGILSWVNRITRIRERCADLFGHCGTRWRVIRISNAYHFTDPKGAAFRGVSSKSEFPSETPIQELSPSRDDHAPTALDPDTLLEAALLRFKAVLTATAERK